MITMPKRGDLELVYFGTIKSSCLKETSQLPLSVILGLVTTYGLHEA